MTNKAAASFLLLLNSASAVIASPQKASPPKTAAPRFQGDFHINSASGTATIVTPSGLTLNLTPVTNPSTGVVTYTIASITATVTSPSGVVSTVQITSGTLIGASVGVPGSAGSGTQVAISITPSGASTPLTPAQVSQTVQTSVTTAVNTAVSNGTLPPGTTASSPSPVVTGQFSPSAPQ